MPCRYGNLHSRNSTSLDSEPSTWKLNMNTDNIDKSISPAEDFYAYANGQWQKDHPLGAEYSRYGMFDLIGEQALKQVNDLIENLCNDPASKEKDTNTQKVNDIYRLGLDIDRRNREGAAPIMPVVKRIESTTRENLYDTLAWLHRGAGGGFFGFGVGASPDDSSMNILYITECGLSLGDRDYYLVENDDNKRILEAYHKYVVTIMGLVGYDVAACERVWNAVIRIEKEMASHKRTREERRNPQLSHNWMDYSDFKSRYNSIDWDSVLYGAGLPHFNGMNVNNPEYMDFINGYMGDLDMQQIRDYLVFTAVAEGSGTLSDDFSNADFELFGRVMSGREEKRPLWKRVMSVVNSMFGEAVGQLYVEKYFPVENKEYMLLLVRNLQKALGIHINQLPWMSPATKDLAEAKLKKMRLKIGYPDKWKDYSGIHIDPARSYHENILNAAEWFVQDGYSKLGKPVDRDEWFMTPQTVNAYYSPVMNEICFPAGILQPPYFDINSSAAANYGAIGVVIGHEMTHGFDDQGRQFDEDGNLKNWWTTEDEKQFNALADKLVEQFNTVEVAPGEYANGRFTLGENIADQGGLRIALTALKIASGDSELTSEELKEFYLSYAQVWASNIRPEEILRRLKSDPHSLELHRVNETLKNISQFMEAFDVKEGNGMYRAPEDRVTIW